MDRGHTHLSVQFELRVVAGRDQYPARVPGKLVGQGYLFCQLRLPIGTRRTLLASGSGSPPHHEIIDVTLRPSAFARERILIAALRC